MQSLLDENVALLAGGKLSVEEMDLFYETITKVYISSKEEARAKFTRTDYRTDKAQ